MMYSPASLSHIALLRLDEQRVNKALFLAQSSTSLCYSSVTNDLLSAVLDDCPRV